MDSKQKVPRSELDFPFISGIPLVFFAMDSIVHSESRKFETQTAIPAGTFVPTTYLKQLFGDQKNSLHLLISRSSIHCHNMSLPEVIAARMNDESTIKLGTTWFEDNLLFQNI